MLERLLQALAIFLLNVVSSLSGSFGARPSKPPQSPFQAVFRLSHRIKRLEGQVASLEQRIAELEQQMASSKRRAKVRRSVAEPRSEAYQKTHADSELRSLSRSVSE